jgi:hypothetical protein
MENVCLIVLIIVICVSTIIILEKTRWIILAFGCLAVISFAFYNEIHRDDINERLSHGVNLHQISINGQNSFFDRIKIVIYNDRQLDLIIHISKTTMP